MKIELQNKNVYVQYRTDDKEIFIRDLTDRNNDPAAYTISKRGLKKAFEAIESRWSEDMKYREVCDIFVEFKIRWHSWYMMD